MIEKWRPFQSKAFKSKIKNYYYKTEMFRVSKYFLLIILDDRLGHNIIPLVPHV